MVIIAYVVAYIVYGRFLLFKFHYKRLQTECDYGMLTGL